MSVSARQGLGDLLGHHAGTVLCARLHGLPGVGAADATKRAGDHEDSWVPYIACRFFDSVDRGLSSLLFMFLKGYHRFSLG